MDSRRDVDDGRCGRKDDRSENDAFRVSSGRCRGNTVSRDDLPTFSSCACLQLVCSLERFFEVKRKCDSTIITIIYLGIRFPSESQYEAIHEKRWFQISKGVRREG